ncbi:MAG: hypothetical protein M1831_004628 [Alyxoria varia]|nr:MAG: hypothetical protein M1831_004628 [Alyxoria varia]
MASTGSRNNPRKKQKQRRTPAQAKDEAVIIEPSPAQVATTYSPKLAPIHDSVQKDAEEKASSANDDNSGARTTNYEPTTRPEDSRRSSTPITRNLLAAPCISCDITALIYLPKSLSMSGTDCNFRERLGLSITNTDTLVPTICAQCEQDQLCLLGRITHSVHTRAIQRPPVLLNTDMFSAWPLTTKLVRSYSLRYDSSEQQKVAVRRANWWHSGLIQQASTNGAWEDRGNSDVATGKIEFVQIKSVSNAGDAVSSGGLEIIPREKKRCDSFFGFFDSP